VRHAALRKSPGYDLSDPWLVKGPADGAAAGDPFLRLVVGAPCQMVGTGEIVGYLGPGQGTSGECRVRPRTGNIITCPRSSLLPLPTRQACQGEWAMATNLSGPQAYLNGQRGMCGLAGTVEGTERISGMWVMFEAADSTQAPHMALIAETNLAALPGPGAGAALTPWESRSLPFTNSLATASGDAPPALVDEGALEKQ